MVSTNETLYLFEDNPFVSTVMGRLRSGSSTEGTEENTVVLSPPLLEVLTKTGRETLYGFQTSSSTVSGTNSRPGTRRELVPDTPLDEER